MASLMTTAGQAWLKADPQRWVSADIRVRLVVASETGVNATLAAMTGVGLPASDTALAGRQVNYNAAFGLLRFPASNAITPAVASGDIDRAVVFAFDTNDASSLPLCVADVVPQSTADGRTFRLDWDAEGLVWINLNPLPPDGGAYPPATYSRAGALTTDLTTALSSLVPRNAAGTPDAAGKMMLLGLGMSSAKTFHTYMKPIIRDQLYTAAFHSKLIFQFASNSGRVADNYANPADVVWSDAVTKAGQGYNPCTVQQVLHITIMLTQSWPAEEGWRDGSIVTPIGYMTSSQLSQIVANAKANFPNLVSMDIHSHAWTGLSTSGQAPVASIHSDDALIAGFAGTHSGVLVDYLQVYAQGSTYNAQHVTAEFPLGLRWLPEDFTTDNIHPSVLGTEKMVDFIISRWHEDAVKAWMWA